MDAFYSNFPFAILPSFHQLFFISRMKNTRENTIAKVLHRQLSPIYLFISSNNFSTRERKFKRSYNFIFHSCNNFSLISRNSRISKIARGDAKHVHRWIFTYVKFLSRFSVHSRFNFFSSSPRKKRRTEEISFRGPKKNTNDSRSRTSLRVQNGTTRRNNEHGFQRYS